MEIQFDITRLFDKDISQLPASDQNQIADSIDQYAATYDIERCEDTPHVYQPHPIALPDGLESSLYVLKVAPQIRVILAIDNDPIFDRRLITLFRAVEQDELNQAFDSIAQTLYQTFGSNAPS
jgi:hypothetical protein